MEEKIDAKDGSRLLMRIWRGSHSVQGMGIWGDRAFVLHDTGICGVHDLRGSKRSLYVCFRWAPGMRERLRKIIEIMLIPVCSATYTVRAIPFRFCM